MDISPHDLRTAELREAWRGYRQDDVDELLDRSATTIERLQAQVERLGERLTRAEDEAGMGREADEMLRRTLLLAQRTADAAVSEAQERARRLVAESEAQAHATMAKAEAEARRAGEAERARLEDEIRSLVATRDALVADTEALRQVADGHRDKLRALFESQLAALEAQPVPEGDALPELHEPVLPEPEGEATRALSVEELAAELAADAEAADAEPVEVEAAEVVAGPVSPGSAFDASSEAIEAIEAIEAAEPVEAAEAIDGIEPVDAEVSDAAVPDLPAPAAPANPSADLLPRRELAVNLDDDDFFAELKAAVEDDAPLGPRDEDDEAWLDWASGDAVLYDQDATDEQGRLRSMFRRRG